MKLPIHIDFGREITGNLDAILTREWLVTNGIGGYAMGTVAGTLSRRYHGYLVAALQPPLGRTILLTKLEESVIYDGLAYDLSVNEWEDGEIDPNGHIFLERFRLEGTTPVWTYALADALLEKRIWMEPGENTTYIRYSLVRGTSPVTFQFGTFLTYRDHHANTPADDDLLDLGYVVNGLRATPKNGAPFYVYSNKSTIAADQEWVSGLYWAVEAHRGTDEADRHLLAGAFEGVIQPGNSVTFIATTGENPSLDADAAWARRTAHEAEKLARGTQPDDPAWAAQLILAADQFIVTRGEGHTVLAGYPWFSDWGRDTMIALPGLTLATGQPEIARSILATFARFVSEGMLPNRFPDGDETPEYNTVDATLWYFEAIRVYIEQTKDLNFLKEIYPLLQAIIEWHQRGTRYGICVDSSDGLLRAGEPGVQLTWMDVKIDDWVVTPRTGKPVEINALWYNALRCMAEFAKELGEDPQSYNTAADKVLDGFGRFWNDEVGYCYDVLDTPEGDPDDTLRPNQLFAVSLYHSPLSPQQHKRVVDACAKTLVTSHGLRSLTPDHPDFIGTYGGDQPTRDAAYHQGTVWGWLIGPFVGAYLRVYDNADQSYTFLEPLTRQIADHGLGTLAEIFEGFAPFTPRGCVAQAWSVAEVLRVWREIQKHPGFTHHADLKKDNNS